MKRLIDANALESSIATRYEQLVKECGSYDHYTAGYGDALFAVEQALTVDAVEVVRCGECKHQIIKKHIPSRYCEVWQGYVGHGDDGYCAYGERREE